MIKPVTKWVAVSPKGQMQLDALCSSERAARRALADDAEQWRSLKADGWQVIKVRIAHVVDKGKLRDAS